MEIIVLVNRKYLASLRTILMVGNLQVKWHRMYVLAKIILMYFSMYVSTQKWVELEQEHIHYTYERTFRQNTYVNVLSWTLDMYKAIHTKHFIYTLCIFSVFSLVLNILYGITYLQDYSKIWNIAKSNKSELWNRLSYRGLPYLFEVRSQTFRNNCKISRSQPQNSIAIVIRPQWPRKAQVRI